MHQNKKENRKKKLRKKPKQILKMKQSIDLFVLFLFFFFVFVFIFLLFFVCCWFQYLTLYFWFAGKDDDDRISQSLTTFVCIRRIVTFPRRASFTGFANYNIVSLIRFVYAKEVKKNTNKTTKEKKKIN